ncbi:MAG: hypothetical protein WHW07_09540 [Bacteroidales bacterium]|jgi:hypothetical protein|nr:hypothetical protein [Bacteroidales bacterium]HOL97113.1 hypothetical protein [Bacteroidales bacterium]HOM35406.1 hypothetical protein [Bacteroidales bacterium]HPD23103.1 hypothetical protein [Bacteroidales bacterium]HRS99391.1 hypothetical protein [Bacteroidales bacterium]
MKNFQLTALVLFLLIITSNAALSQTASFKELTQKTLQSYSDRGYSLVNHTQGKISLAEPLVGQEVNLDYKTYYIVLVQLDGCLYCSYQLYYVDKDNNLIPVNYEVFVDNNLKQLIYKFTSDKNTEGKFVVLLDSDLNYFGNLFVFKK